MKKRRRYASRRKEEVADLESQSGHTSLRQAEGGGGIAPKDQDLVDILENTVSIY